MSIKSLRELISIILWKGGGGVFSCPFSLQEQHFKDLFSALGQFHALLASCFNKSQQCAHNLPHYHLVTLSLRRVQTTVIRIIHRYLIFHHLPDPFFNQNAVLDFGCCVY